MSLTRWLILLLAVTGLSLLLAVAAVYFLSWRNLDQRQREQWADYAQAVVRQTEARSRDLQALVGALARDPRWPEILDSSDWEVEERRLAGMIPEFLWVRLLPPDLEEPTGRLSFADLDLIRQAAGEDPPPAVQGAAAERHLAVARAIRDGDRVLAVLLVALDPAWVRQGLPTPKRGALAITQGDLTLARRGDDALPAAEPGATIPIPGTRWQLRYWLPPAEPEGIWWVVLAVLLALLPVSALVYACRRWWKQAVAKDGATLLNLVNDLMNGTVASSYVTVVQELQPLIDRLLIVSQSRHVRPEARYPVAEPETAKETAPAPEPLSAGPPVAPSPPSTLTVPESVFTACHLRGDVETLTPEVFHALGRAIGSEVQAQGEQTVSVGRDRREGSEARAAALIEGLRASGCDVLDLGAVPTPLVSFACHYLTSRSGVMVTGGSAPAEHTGLKVVIAGELWHGDRLRQLHRRLQDQDLKSGMGSVESRDLLADYIGAVIDDVQIGRPMKVVVDAGAGVAGEVVPALLRTLGCEVAECRSETMLDPGVGNALERLCAQVRNDPEAELGLAFDGDGDRLAVVDARGRWVPADRVLMLLVADVLSREPGGDVVFDLECGRHLARHIVQHGGRPVVAPVGYCHLYAKAEASAAPLAGGFSGHLIFRERWFGIDDAIYGAARLLEILSAEPETSDEVFAQLPQNVSTPYLEVTLESGRIENAMKILQATADKFFDDAKVDMTSGVRTDFADGWGIVRPADGYDALRLRFEADDRKALERIQARFQEWFDTVELAVTLPDGVEVSDG